MHAWLTVCKVCVYLVQGGGGIALYGCTLYRGWRYCLLWVYLEQGVEVSLLLSSSHALHGHLYQYRVGRPAGTEDIWRTYGGHMEDIRRT